MRKFRLVAALALVCTFIVVGLLLVFNDRNTSVAKPDSPPRPTTNPLVATDPLAKNAGTIDAARLLTQASFGVNHASMDAIAQYASLDQWIDEQMALPATLQLPSVEVFGNSSFRAPRHYVWWHTAIKADDQLRQRVAFALSEIFVVSDIDYTLGNAQFGMVSFYDMLATNAFGNFRDLLEDITLHPVMGVYLSMVRNEKADPERNIRPDENYAREIMQLFTIGLYELDAGGTPVPVGHPKPAYTQKDVEEYARVFTGWNFADSPEWQSSDLTSYDKTTPMVPQEAFHDKGSKQLLNGIVAPAGLTAREDLELALDSLFNHPNVGPFLAKAIIQRLVSSNPSTAYVTRVAAVFNDNGSGVRGDMGATIKAILLDTEARQGYDTVGSGKLKEPLLRATHILRALSAAPGANADGQFHMSTKTSDAVNDIFGQVVQSAASVFNFFSPSFRSGATLPDDPQTPLYAPELQILSESLVSAANNDLHGLIYNANNRTDNQSRASIINLDGPMFMLRTGRDVYLEHMNMLLMSGTMSADMQAVIADYIDNTVAANRIDLPAPAMQDDATDQQLAELDESVLETIVVDSIFMMLASPEYMVQR